MLYAELTAPPPLVDRSERRAQSQRFRSAGSTRLARRPWRLGAVALATGAALIAAVLLNRSVLDAQPVLAIDLQPAGASLSCKLPISAVSNNDTTGFIVMDHGQATFQQVKTDGTTYIPGLGIWASVLPQMVAPDGRAFVSDRLDYARKHELITITDARGTRTLLDTKVPDELMAMAYTANGSILVTGPSNSPGDWRIELLDPTTGRLSPLPFAMPSAPIINGVRVGSLGFYDRNSNAIWSGFFQGDNSTIWSVDYATGGMTQWFNPSDGKGTAQVVATDKHGAPIIQLSTSDAWHTDAAHRNGIAMQTMLMTAPHRFTVLNQGHTGERGVAGAFSPLSATSGNSIWFATDDGAIWLYRAGEGLKQIASVHTRNSGAPGIAISGPCK
ncbi:MAG TPA: hypothetical protein VFR68_14030 [Candidatus Dormibacteraeota bacterium]|nr:hypothetical protein [Candidatus Dormibacteraeota bacterium]